LPDPLPDTVIHDVVVVADQLHALVTEMVPNPPDAGTEALVGEIPTVQDAPDWVKLNVCPPMLIVPLRLPVPVFAAAE
jgi:hypothetical protein